MTLIYSERGGVMDKLDDHEGFWGHAEELIDRAKRLQKVAGVNLKTISVRLVRYYAAEGVIDKPDRLGREAAYHYKHLLQLLLARKLSDHGVTLSEIKTLIAGQSPPEIEGKLSCSVDTLLADIKRRRIKETSERANESLEYRRKKEENPNLEGLEIEFLTSQMKSVGDSLKTAFYDALEKRDLEIAIQNERLQKTIDEIHYLLRESIENKKEIAYSLEKVSERLVCLEAMGREPSPDLGIRSRLMIDQLTDRITSLEASLQEFSLGARNAKSKWDK
jgi:DNA-binding transcriptional MerR regulator